MITKNKVCAYIREKTAVVSKTTILRVANEKLFMEKRMYERYYTSTLCIFRENGGHRVATTVDLSLGGAKISSDTAFPLARTLDLFLVLGSRANPFRGEVVYCQKAGAPEHGQLEQPGRLRRLRNRRHPAEGRFPSPHHSAGPVSAVDRPGTGRLRSADGPRPQAGAVLFSRTTGSRIRGAACRPGRRRGTSSPCRRRPTGARLSGNKRPRRGRDWPGCRGRETGRGRGPGEKPYPRRFSLRPGSGRPWRPPGGSRFRGRCTTSRRVITLVGPLFHETRSPGQRRIVVLLTTEASPGRRRRPGSWIAAESPPRAACFLPLASDRARSASPANIFRPLESWTRRRPSVRAGRASRRSSWSGCGGAEFLELEIVVLDRLSDAFGEQGRFLDRIDPAEEEQEFLAAVAAEQVVLADEARIMAARSRSRRLPASWPLRSL